MSLNRRLQEAIRRDEARWLASLHAPQPRERLLDQHCGGYDRPSPPPWWIQGALDEEARLHPRPSR
jgi:hypothetical protein